MKGYTPGRVPEGLNLVAAAAAAAAAAAVAAAAAAAAGSGSFRAASRVDRVGSGAYASPRIAGEQQQLGRCRVSSGVRHGFFHRFSVFLTRPAETITILSLGRLVRVDPRHS